MQEEFAMILKLTFDANTIYTVIYWAKIVFSLCLQRDLERETEEARRLLEDAGLSLLPAIGYPTGSGRGRQGRDPIKKGQVASRRKREVLNH